MAAHLPTQTRFGPYEIIGKLGAGGMGAVYRARDTRLGRDVAIKILSPEAATNPELKRRFENEARAASALNHPNIVAIYDVGFEHDQSYIVSELVEGRSMRALMHEGTLTLNQMLHLVIQVADGLAAAHEAGIVHRDLKPENIMVSRDGRAKILDFGLAKLIPTIPQSQNSQIDTQIIDESQPPQVRTTPGVILGTVSYMSPEQASGDPIGFHSDQFSFGVILYEMISGKRPFDRANTIQTLAAIITDPAPPLQESDQRMPEAFCQLIARCLAKSPGKRFPTTRDLMEELQVIHSLCSGESAITLRLWDSTPPITKHAWGLPTRHLRTGLFGLIVTLLLVALVFPAVKYFRERAKARNVVENSAIDSIAVLPFVNTISDPSTEYLSDGITENIINSLSHVPGLRVMARSTVFRYKGSEVDPQKVGQELKVRSVLTGRVTQRNKMLVISTELVDVKDGSRLWGEQYNSTTSDILFTQDEIAEDISTNLQFRLTGEQRQKVIKHFTENSEAHQAYLRGRYAWNKRTRESLEAAVEHFKQAIRIDPNYALAYAGLADTYGLMGYYGLRRPREAYPEAKEAVLKALELDPNIAEAHASLADIKMYYDWDWAGAEREFRRAIDLNPGYATAHQWLAICLELLGRTDEALQAAQRAQQLDPLSLPVNTTVAHLYYYSRQYDRAILECRRVLEIDRFVNTHAFLGMSYEQKGLYPEALAEFQKALALSNNNPAVVAMIGHTLALSGKRDEATKLLTSLQKRAQTEYVPAYCLAVIAIGLGDEATAFKYLEKSLEERYREMVFLNIEPRFDPIRQDPRFAHLLRKVGLLPKG